MDTDKKDSDQGKRSGKLGEELAEKILIEAGHEIIERNYHYKKGEVDLISLIDNRLLVFVEVKLRNQSAFGEPENFVSESQMERIIHVADHYIHAINWQKDIRFDVISIRSDTGETKWFEDAFY